MVSRPPASTTALPDPGPEAAALAARLSADLTQRIRRAGGWLSFATFMDGCLYTPGLGYYSNALTKLGSGIADDSDFVTAPELSPLFGRTLARHVAAVNAGHPDSVVLELGAGSGKLACDLLQELAVLDALPRQYQILDLSGDLRVRQAALLHERIPRLVGRVQWLDQLPATFRGCVVANEVLDATPVHLVVWDGQVWHERGVGTDASGGFVWVDQPADAALQEALATRLCAAGLLEANAPASAIDQLPPGYLTELNLAAPALVSSLAERLEHGSMLWIDYGFPAAEYFHPQRNRGTLMAHYRHRAHDDVLARPGLQDLTSHVDFTAIAQAGFDAGLDVLGYASQGQFLIDCGIASLLQGDPSSPATWLPQTNALQRLISEAEMGELFKVIALGRGIDTTLPGFRRGDRTATL